MTLDKVSLENWCHILFKMMLVNLLLSQGGGTEWSSCCMQMVESQNYKGNEIRAVCLEEPFSPSFLPGSVSY